MNKPFSILLLPLIVGILLFHYFVLNEMVIFFMLLFFVVVLIYNIFMNKSNEILVLFIFFIIGIFITMVNSNSILIREVDNRIKCIGVVDEVLNRNEDREKYIVIVEKLGKKTVKEKIILNIIGQKDLKAGDKIVFNGELRLPSINGNPKLFNYRLNLMSEKIFTTMTIKEHSITSIDSSSRPFKYQLKNRFTKDIELLFDRYLDIRESSLMKSIILGRSLYLEEENLNLYRDLGLAHILAVSGLHIGIISGFFMFVFSRLGIKKRKNILLTLIILWTYGYIIGFPTSILRANIMISILLYSQLIHEPYDSINSLSFAFTLLLIINPYYLFNIGFQLSFIASFSILVFTPRIRALFYPKKDYIITSVASIVGVQLGLIPIQSYYFNRISILGILANIVFIPILSMALVLGFMMIIFNYVFIFINNILGPFLNFILSIQFKILNIFTRLPMNIKIFSPEIISIIMYYILIFIVLRIFDIDNLNKSIVKTLVIYLVLIIVFNVSIIAYDDSVELHFIDVGQGDAMLIRTKGKDYLIDTGGSLLNSFDIGKNITLPYLEKLGIRNLDALFITHFHEDHSQGLMALLDEVDIGTVIASYIPLSNMVYDEVIHRGIPYRIVKTNDRISLGKGLEFITLWPNKDLNIDYNENNMSLVSLLVTSRHTILLTGDMEKEVEYLIADKLKDTIDIIKVPHHGSKTSSTEKLLNNIKPKVAIISLGKNNMYGHPDDEVIERYNSIGTKIYRTDYMGLIKVVLTDDGYHINNFLNHGSKIKISLLNFIYNNFFMFSFYFIFYILIYVLLKTLYNEGENWFDL